nr:PREDICTED: uncharacterized protein LOC109030057 [Bemisia tabaci]
MDAHTEDILQNLADNFHVEYLHVPRMGFAGADLDGFWRKWISFFVKLNQKTSWEPDADHPHLSWTRTEFQFKFLKKFFIPNGLQVVKCVGPGYVEVTTLFTNVKAYMTVLITPIGPLKVRMAGQLYTRPCHVLMGRFMLHGYYNNVEDDVTIWNYGKPRLQLNAIKEEGPLVNFRRWYSQFYSNNSFSLDYERRNI